LIRFNSIEIGKKLNGLIGRFNSLFAYLAIRKGIIYTITPITQISNQAYPPENP
jgi:hypothetical protein